MKVHGLNNERREKEWDERERKRVNERDRFLLFK